MKTEEINELSNRVIGYAIKVHRTLGSGFTEKMYGKAFAYELQKNKVKFIQEKTIRVKYEGFLLGEHRLDFLVEDAIIIENKAVYEINNFHMAQMLSYLKAADKKLGLILNFSKAKLEIKRVAYNL